MSQQLTKGSPKFSISLSDGIGTIRDSILLILAEVVSLVGDKWFGDEFTPEIEGAVVVLLFAGFKLVWKYITDTTRIQPL